MLKVTNIQTLKLSCQIKWFEAQLSGEHIDYVSDCSCWGKHHCLEASFSEKIVQISLRLLEIMMLTFHCTATDLWKKKRIPPGAGNVWCLPLWGSALTFHGCPNRQKKILAHTFAARTELFKSMAHVIMMNIIPSLHVFFRVSRMLHLSFVQWEVISTSTVSKVLVDYRYLFIYFYQSILPSLSLP